jgi:hypothetical protein
MISIIMIALTLEAMRLSIATIYRRGNGTTVA